MAVDAVVGVVPAGGGEEAEVADDGGGAEVEELAAEEEVRDAVLGDLAGAVGGDVDAHGAGHADGVGHLDFALLGEAGGDDVAGDVAGVVGRGTVDLGGVFAAEGATTVRTDATIGVDDDFTAGDAGVARGAADDEAAGGIDVQGGVGREETGGGEDLTDDLADGLVDDLLGDVGSGLVGADNVGDGLGLAAIVEDGDLGFGIGAEPGEFAAVAECGQTAEDTVGADERERQTLGGLIGGVTEHHALVASALLFGIFTDDTLVDVGGLCVQVVDVGEILPAEALFGAVVANLLDDALGNGLGVDVLEAAAGHLAQIHDQVHATGRLASDVRMRVERKAGIEDCIGNSVGDLVGVPLGDGFRGVDVSGGKLAHVGSCFNESGLIISHLCASSIFFTKW